jgi:hypothetical protein
MMLCKLRLVKGARGRTSVAPGGMSLPRSPVNGTPSFAARLDGFCVHRA